MSEMTRERYEKLNYYQIELLKNTETAPMQQMICSLFNAIPKPPVVIDDELAKTRPRVRAWDNEEFKCTGRLVYVDNEKLKFLIVDDCGASWWLSNCELIGDEDE